MVHSRFPDILPRWNEYVKLIQFAMNNAVVTRTGMTPLFLFFLGAIRESLRHYICLRPHWTHARSNLWRPSKTGYSKL